MKTSVLALALSLVVGANAQAAGAGAEGTPMGSLWGMLSQLPTQVSRINALNDSQFVFNFIDPTAERTTGAGGFIVAANAATMPALYGHGMALTLGVLGPCTMNSPHTHPRATEFNVALNGTLYTGMLAENGARFVVNEVGVLSATFFPRGAIHFEANLNCDPVYFIAAFNDPDPGVMGVAQRFYGLPPAVVGVALGGLGVDVITATAQAIPDNVIFAMDDCFTKCNIMKPATQPTKQQQPRVSGNAFPAASAASTAKTGGPSPYWWGSN
jgi:oxalate decarboxylase/phosphoglucose isomerase-like protein (cupin superfamily)